MFSGVGKGTVWKHRSITRPFVQKIAPMSNDVRIKQLFACNFKGLETWDVKVELELPVDEPVLKPEAVYNHIYIDQYTEGRFSAWSAFYSFYPFPSEVNNTQNPAQSTSNPIVFCSAVSAGTSHRLRIGSCFLGNTGMWVSWLFFSFWKKQSRTCMCVCLCGWG